MAVGQVNAAKVLSVVVVAEKILPGVLAEDVERRPAVLVPTEVHPVADGEWLTLLPIGYRIDEPHIVVRRRRSV